MCCHWKWQLNIFTHLFCLNCPDICNSEYDLTWWCAVQRTGGDIETGQTCWQVQQDSWCGGTYPKDDAHKAETQQRKLHMNIIEQSNYKFTTVLLNSCLICKLHEWPCARFTLVRVMLNWMVRMTTRMSKLPSEISVSDLSAYQEMFFSTCERKWDSRRHVSAERVRNDWQAQQWLDVMNGFSLRSRAVMLLIKCVYVPPRGWSDWRRRPLWEWGEWWEPCRHDENFSPLRGKGSQGWATPERQVGKTKERAQHTVHVYLSQQLYFRSAFL